MSDSAGEKVLSPITQGTETAGSIGQRDIATPVALESVAGVQASEFPLDAASIAPQTSQLPLAMGIRPSSEQSSAQMSQIVPSACSCGGQGVSVPVRGTPTQLVYALGQLGFDFGTEARRDAFIQNMDEPAPGVQPNPNDPNQLQAYLERNPWVAASLIWTLNLDATPIYAVMPGGPYSDVAFERLRQYLGEQRPLSQGGEGVERVSIAGIIAGQVRLFNGVVVPVIRPEIRGMRSWTTRALVNAVHGPQPKAEATDAEKAAFAAKEAGVTGFLDRVYFELRNLGIAPHDRAVNYAATNAFNVAMIFESALKEKERLELESIEVERSPVCRPDSDCWDVKLMFFFPERQVQTVRRAYRFTVDVSDVVPVTIGPVRSWFVR
jgi:cyanobactin maturation PatA/PatG family protease